MHVRHNKQPAKMFPNLNAPFECMYIHEIDDMISAIKEKNIHTFV